MKRCLLFLALFSVGFADERFPPEGWQDKANPIAGPDATVGGEFKVYAGPYPKSFNYYLDLNTFSSELFSDMYETLLSYNPVTLDLEPALASAWTISDDKMSYTFHMDPNASWSDEHAVTAEDVKWTYDAIMNPKNLTGPHKIDMERFEEPVVLDSRTIKFTAKDAHWKNLIALGFFHILPAHIYATQDFNKINFEFPVVSGRYRLGDIKEGIYAKLERREDWWHRDAPSSKGVGNFQTLKFAFFEDDDNAFEAFKKGALDYYPVHKSHLWMAETVGEKFEQNWIIKQKVENYNPIGFQGFAMNMRRPPFDDVRVRKAMCHLLDRARMNATLMHNQYFLHRSYFEDLIQRRTSLPE